MDAQELSDSRRYLSRIAVWPGPKRLDIDGWLANFDLGTDTEIALALLEAHVHLSEDQIIYAVASTIRSISGGVEFGDSMARPANWAGFVDNVIVAFPLSRAGDVTASGYIFARIAERLSFPEARILDSEHLVRRLAKEGSAPVLFLDDLAASGTQFTRDWKRRYATDHGRLSLEDLYARGSLGPCYYLPVVATQMAKEKIEEGCGVQVIPTYLLDPDYRALDADSRLIPVHLRPLLPEFLRKYSPRTGMNEEGDAGFGELGLALSFHHGCPNNTLPVLRWGPSADGWRPLIS